MLLIDRSALAAAPSMSVVLPRQGLRAGKGEGGCLRSGWSASLGVRQPQQRRNTPAPRRDRWRATWQQQVCRRASRTLRHADAALAVAAERAKRGQHEIAHARQPRDRLAQPKMQRIVSRTVSLARFSARAHPPDGLIRCPSSTPRVPLECLTRYPST